MRSVFLASLVLTLIFSLSYWYSGNAHICPVPISYRVGEIDERFAMSEDRLRDILQSASVVWEGSIGQSLFQYDESARLTVNLIFDERQQLARTEEESRQRLDTEQARYEAQLSELKRLQAQYEADRSSYEADRTSFDRTLASYNAEVEAFNQAGGAPPSEFARLAESEATLRLLSDGLIAAERRLNNLVTEINRLGEAANALIVAYNAEVELYNELFGQRNTITQGEFRRDVISVYKFTDEAELTRVLAHEFGHALGIGHVEGEESVMYYMTTDSSAPPTLSEADKTALFSVCGDTSSFSAQARRVIRGLFEYFN
jgi:hypothetical protein